MGLEYLPANLPEILAIHGSVDIPRPMQHLGYGIPKSLRACPIAVAESIKGHEEAQESPSHLVSVIFMCNLQARNKNTRKRKRQCFADFPIGSMYGIFIYLHIL